MHLGVEAPYSIGEVPARCSLALVVDTLKPRGGGVGYVHLAKGKKFPRCLFLFLAEVQGRNQVSVFWECRNGG
jgi:hypothetical protein